MWAVAPRPAAHRARGRRPRRPRRAVAAAVDGVPRRSSRRCRRSTGSRCAAATRPGCTCSCADHGLDLDDPAIAAAARRARRPTRCSRSRLGARRRTARLGVRLQGGGRDRRARRQHRARCAPRSRDDELLRLALSRADGRGRRCSATPAGRASASSPRPTPTRSTARSSTAGDAARTSSAALNGDVDNYADLKALDGLRIAGRDHHRRQGDPRARVAPASPTGARPRRGVPRARSPRSRARSPSARAVAADARPAAPRAARQRPGALRRPRRRLLRRRQRALRPRRGDATRYLRLDGETPADAEQPAPAAGQVVVLDGAPGRRRSTASSAGRLRRHARCRSPTADAGHAPRSPPATSTVATSPHFLLKEITEAPASFRKTLRGKLVERDGALARRARRPRRCPPTSRDRLRDGAITPRARDRPGHRGRRRAEPGRVRSTRCADGRLDVDAMHGHRALRLRAARRHERHARRRHQPVGHDHRHQPHRRPRARPRRAS